MRRDLPGGFELDDDPARIDVGVVHGFLSSQADWALGWSFEEVERLVAEATMVIGVYRDEEMVGFSRTISDGHWLTYLADVFILPDYRGQGLGEELVRATVEDGPFRDLGWLLHAAEAHDLFAKFGFERRSPYLMERPPPD